MGPHAPGHQPEAWRYSRTTLPTPAFRSSRGCLSSSPASSSGPSFPSPRPPSSSCLPIPPRNWSSCLPFLPSCRPGKPRSDEGCLLFQNTLWYLAACRMKAKVRQPSAPGPSGNFSSSPIDRDALPGSSHSPSLPSQVLPGIPAFTFVCAEVMVQLRHKGWSRCRQGKEKRRSWSRDQHVS